MCRYWQSKRFSQSVLFITRHLSAFPSRALRRWNRPCQARYCGMQVIIHIVTKPSWKCVSNSLCILLPFGDYPLLTSQLTEVSASPLTFELPPVPRECHVIEGVCFQSAQMRP